LLFFGCIKTDGFWGYLFEFIWIYAMVSIVKIIYYYRFSVLELNVLAVFGAVLFFVKSYATIWIYIFLLLVFIGVNLLKKIL
jgi:hypothetical protein